MHASDFTEDALGQLVAIGQGAHAFVPGRIPRGSPLPAETSRKLGEARAALGKLEAGVTALPSSSLFVGPFQVNEAVLSSRIEGTQTTLVDALADKATGLAEFADKDALAVRNYTEALQLGLSEIGSGRPLSMVLLRAMQGALLRHSKHAGGVRTIQVGIGSEECRFDISLARYIPPPPEHVQACLDDLMSYLTEDPIDDPLVRVAWTHYQFEAIHPFQDGNGRVGRLLIALQMVSERAVSKPWIYLSPEIEQRREAYINAMYGVSATGAWVEWLNFFFDVVLVSAQVTLGKLERLRSLETEYVGRLRGYQSQLPIRLLTELFRMPVLTIPEAAKYLACSSKAARSTLLELTRIGVVQKMDDSLRYRKQKGRPPDLYWSPEIVRTVMRHTPPV